MCMGGESECEDERSPRGGPHSAAEQYEGRVRGLGRAEPQRLQCLVY